MADRNFSVPPWQTILIHFNFPGIGFTSINAKQFIQGTETCKPGNKRDNGHKAPPGIIINTQTGNYYSQQNP